ncbi:Vacuolar protein sorting-associated protein 16 [Microbotryomycetes sp. JL201]|nr:Vacuolar protein sorting-associated protein 16 [Microbotryomycetes sp. JL201]
MTDTPHGPASANWEPLGETFYRKQDIYTMQWNMQDLSDYILSASLNGGPIAVIRDNRKPVLITSNDMGQINAPGKAKIIVYSAAGVLMQTIQWDSSARIVALGWTVNENLAVLTQDGSYRIYSLSIGTSVSPSYSQHSLGHEAQEAGVLEARIYEHGMVVLLNNLTFIEVRGWDSVAEEASSAASSARQGGKIIPLANAGLTDPPASWCVLPSDDSQSRHVEVLVSTNHTILRIDEIDVVDQRITRGPFTKISASPNGRLLGLLSHPAGVSPQLWVASSDFTRSLSELDLGNEGETTAPGQIVWCGNNTVVVAWDRTLVMMGPFGESLKYFYADPVALVGEMDGTRIISNDAHELLQIVPQTSQDVFRPGSASPAAILFEASELFDAKSPRADEYVRSIKRDLVSAVDTCIDAAGKEFDVFWQKRLLKAATFGKTFIDVYNPTAFVEMTQTLRVLNAVRSFDVGIPVTYEEFKSRAASYLIDRLTARSKHLLALRISTYLRLSTAPVLKHWARTRIAALGTSLTSPSEDAICQEIVSKLANQYDVSCADVAHSAWVSGKSGLATKLLEHEKRASKQVPLLLSMKEEDLALTKAIESGDPNLVYIVLIQLRKTHALGDFFRFVDRKPDAVALLKVFAKENDIELLRDFYYQDDRWKETACLELEQSLSTEDFGERMAKVRSAAKSFGDDRDCAFEAKMTDEYLKLLTFQQSLEQESPGKSYVGLSVNDTIRHCIVNGQHKKADKLRSDFKVSDKRFWYIKMKALVSLRDWESLELFARSKKSPIGFEPWVEHLIATGHHRQAVNFIGRCEPKNRVELYVQTGEWNLAGQECVRKGERGKLLELKSRAPNSVIAAQLDSLLSDMDNANV